MAFSGCMKETRAILTYRKSGFPKVLRWFYDTAQVVENGVFCRSHTRMETGTSDWARPTHSHPIRRNGPYYYNYVITYFEKTEWRFQTGWPDDFPFSLRIPGYLTPDDPRPKRSRGLSWIPSALLSSGRFMDTIKFEAFIYDPCPEQEQCDHHAWKSSWGGK